MKAFARITAVIFVALGILIILGGLVFAVSGFISKDVPASDPYGIMPDLSGVITLATLAGGGVISLQGFFLAAIGQGIWLLVEISNNTERTSIYLGTLMRRKQQ